MHSKPYHCLPPNPLDPSKDCFRRFDRKPLVDLSALETFVYGLGFSGLGGVFGGKELRFVAGRETSALKTLPLCTP